jgi:hypothetical protein
MGCAWNIRHALAPAVADRRYSPTHQLTPTSHDPDTYRAPRPVSGVYPSLRSPARLRTGGGGHAAVFRDHAAERAYDGADAGTAGLYPAGSGAGPQHHPAGAAGIPAALAPRPDLTHHAELNLIRHSWLVEPAAQREVTAVTEAWYCRTRGRSNEEGGGQDARATGGCTIRRFTEVPCDVPAAAILKSRRANGFLAGKPPSLRPNRFPLVWLLSLAHIASENSGGWLASRMGTGQRCRRGWWK